VNDLNTQLYGDKWYNNNIEAINKLEAYYHIITLLYHHSPIDAVMIKYGIYCIYLKKLKFK